MKYAIKNGDASECNSIGYVGRGFAAAIASRATPITQHRLFIELEGLRLWPSHLLSGCHCQSLQPRPGFRKRKPLESEVALN